MLSESFVVYVKLISIDVGKVWAAAEAVDLVVVVAAVVVEEVVVHESDNPVIYCLLVSENK